MKNKLDKESARGRAPPRLKSSIVYLHEARWPICEVLPKGLPILQGRISPNLRRKGLFSIERYQEQRTHLKRTSHAKMKYGMSPFAIQLNIKNFACHSAISAFSAPHGSSIPVPYRPTALIVRPLISLACCPSQIRDDRQVF